MLINVPDPQIFTREVIEESIENALLDQSSSISQETVDDDTSLSTLNGLNALEQQTFWKAAHHEKHLQLKAHEQELKHQQEINARMRKLATKDIAPTTIKEYAERDVDIISGKDRSKHSMR